MRLKNTILSMLLACSIVANSMAPSFAVDVPEEVEVTAEATKHAYPENDTTIGNYSELTEAAIAMGQAFGEKKESFTMNLAMDTAFLDEYRQTTWEVEKLPQETEEADERTDSELFQTILLETLRIVRSSKEEMLDTWKSDEELLQKEILSNAGQDLSSFLLKQYKIVSLTAKETAPETIGDIFYTSLAFTIQYEQDSDGKEKIEKESGASQTPTIISTIKNTFETILQDFAPVEVQAATVVPEGEATISKSLWNSMKTTLSMTSNAKIFRKTEEQLSIGTITDEHENAVKIDDGTTGKSIYVWSDVDGNFYWWSDAGKVYLPADASEMFQGCSSLEILEINEMDSSKVTSLYGAFWKCPSLKSLDISSWNVGNVTNMQGTFSECFSLISLNLSGWNVEKVTNMQYTFYSCSSLTSLDLSEWNVGKVSNMDYMFDNCTSLENLNVTSFNTSDVVYARYMFMNCSSLVDLDLSSFSTPKLYYCYNMFTNCSNLTSLDLSNFNMKGVNSAGEMFDGCTKLSKMKLGENFMFHGVGVTWIPNWAMPPSPNPTGTERGDYTGRWTRGTPYNHTDAIDCWTLESTFDGSTMADTWYWEQVGDDPITQTYTSISRLVPPIRSLRKKMKDILQQSMHQRE